MKIAIGSVELHSLIFVIDFSIDVVVAAKTAEAHVSFATLNFTLSIANQNLHILAKTPRHYLHCRS